MADVTLTELIDMLSELFTNMNNLDKTYYDMFYNTTPMDITLQRYDENGVLQNVVIPNRAKDKDSVITGNGEPEGVVPASIGKLYIDLNTTYLYYKTQGTADAPNASGWSLVFTTVNSGNIFQLKAEKGQPNGYPTLDANGKVPADQLPAQSITYYATEEYITIQITLLTTLTIESSNPALEIENNYIGTMPDVGIVVKVLTENTLVTHEFNEDVLSEVGTVIYDNISGIATGFSGSNYLSTNLYGTEVSFTTGNVNTQTETLSTVASTNKIEVASSATTLTVNSSNPDLVITNSYSGRKDIGTEVITLTFREVMVWDNNICAIQGTLDTTTPVIGGFTTANYLVPNMYYNSEDTLVISFMTGSDITTGQSIVGENMAVSIKDGYLGYNRLTVQDFAQVVAVTANTQYYLKCTYDSTNSTNIVSYSTDGDTWTQIVPSEQGGLFILGPSTSRYTLGKGNLDGQQNVVFNGTINSMESYIETTDSLDTFATQTNGWYNGNTEVQLSTYSLEITSGTPVANDTLTLTYVTTPPMIGTEEVAVDTEYMFRWNNTSLYQYVPQIFKGNEWVNVGSAITTDTNVMYICNGTFNGAVDLMDSKTCISSIETTKNYTEVGVLNYSYGVASGFSNSKYITMDTPTADGTFYLNIATGDDVTTAQSIIQNNYNSVLTNLSISGGKLVVTDNGIDYDTNISGIGTGLQYYFKFTRTSGAWTCEFSADNSVWETVTYNSQGSFDTLFQDVLTIGKGFGGSMNFGSSSFPTADGNEYMLVSSRVVEDNNVSMLTTEYTYRWYDEDNTQVDLANYGLTITSGTPETGDTLTLTFTTTEA